MDLIFDNWCGASVFKFLKYNYILIVKPLTYDIA